MIKVSVIMACYNAESYIVSSVESVLRQTYKNLELIIVDDASSDNSLAIARSLADKDSRIKLFSLEKNSGAGTARNFAISKADGDWLAILDADDVFLPDKLEFQVEVVSKPDLNIVLIGTDSYEIDMDGNRFSSQKYPTRSVTLINNLVRQKRFPPHSSLMYRADVVKTVGGYDNRLCPSEDYNLWLRLSGYGSFASVSKPLVEYRHHVSNISKANAGFEQLKFGFAAAICYFLRSKNQTDPLNYSSIEDWNNFIDWLSVRLEKEDILSYRHKKEEYRILYFRRADKVSGILWLLASILTDPSFILKFIYEKIYGTFLPELLADEWIKHGKLQIQSLEKNKYEVKVSVIMACHNTARFISQAIESVVNQTFKNLELIIVDDASCDKTFTIATEAAMKDPRISVHSLPQNFGAGVARNLAIEKARGDWISILDSDDVFLKEKIELQYRQIEKSGPDIVLIGSDSFEIDTSGRRFSIQKYPANSKKLVNHLVRRKRFPPHSSLMYRADIVRKLGCYNTRYQLAQDFDLWLRLSNYGSFSSVPRPLIEYRHHASNISNLNSGFDQLKFGFAASICYFIREKINFDPSIHLSSAEWEDFMRWVTKKLDDEENTKEFMKKRMKWRNEFITCNSKFVRLIKTIKVTFMNPVFSMLVIKERLYGTKLPEKLANAWIEQFMHSETISNTSLNYSQKN